MPAFRNGQRRDLAEIEREIRNIAAEIAGANRAGHKQPGQTSLGRCPRCGSSVVEMPDRYACEKSVADVGACKFKISKNILSRSLDRAQVQRLLASGRTDLLTGFVSKSGRQFPAFLVIDETGKVSFEFPAQAEQQPTQPAYPTASLLRGARPARILLLDDEPFVTDAMKLMLQFYFKDYTVAECRTGDDGWDAILQQSPDLLITDYGHPGLRLEEMLPRLSRRSASFPIIIASAYVSGLPDLQAQLLSQRGLTIKLLNKPFQAEELKAKVLECLTAIPFVSAPDSVADNSAKADPISDLRPATDCKPLLAAATQELFQRNAFRITGLPVEATTRQVAKHATNLGQMAELGLEASHQAGLFAIKPPPALDEVREAVQRLKDPESRLIDELFWFWPCQAGAAQADPALEALASGKGDTALKVWKTVASNPGTACAAAHNIALFWHITAIDSEAKIAPNGSVQNGHEVEAAWRTGLAEWGRLADDDGLWERLATHAKRIDDPRLKPSFLRSMRATLPLALAKINAQLALSHAESGRKALATMHVRLLREAVQGGPLLEKATEIVLTPLVGRLHESIRRAKETTRDDPNNGANAVRHLLEQAKQLPDIFDLFYGEQETSAKEVLDEAATTCIDLIVSYQKNTGDNQTFVDLLEQTLPLADAAEVRQRIEKNVQIGKDNLAYARLVPIRSVCEAAAKAADADPESADEQADRILKAAAEILPQLSSSSLSEEILTRVYDEVALATLHCAVAFGNKTEKWKVCIPILEQALRLALSSDAKRRISENLATVRRNNTLYGDLTHDLTPISSAPSLSTINGFGFMLLGSADHDQKTGSYLATYYFVMFFLPIFPIARYRVTQNGNSYRFFGKAPLRTCDKWHIAISVGLIIAAFFAIGSSANSSSSSSTSYTPPNRNYNYTPPTYTPPSQPTYDGEKAQIETQRQAVQQLKAQVEQLGREIDLHRPYVDNTSDYAVDQFNAKVAAYNDLLLREQAAIQAFNQRVDTYNARHGR